MAAPTTRLIQDANCSANVALPNAANTVNTNGIDLGATTPWPITEKIHIKVATTAATGANTKNINVRLMDSADNITFANVATAPNPLLQVTDNSGYAASSATVQLPIGVRRYVRATALGEANGGNAADGTLTVSLLF